MNDFFLNSLQNSKTAIQSKQYYITPGMRFIFLSKKVLITMCSYFSMKTYVVGTHYKYFAETLLMSTHNICLHGDTPSYL